MDEILVSDLENLFGLLDRIQVNYNDWTVTPDPEGAVITDSALGSEIGIIFSSKDYDASALTSSLVLSFRIAHYIEALIREYESDIQKSNKLLSSLSAMLQLTKPEDASKRDVFISNLLASASKIIDGDAGDGYEDEHEYEDEYEDEYSE